MAAPTGSSLFPGMPAIRGECAEGLRGDRVRQRLQIQHLPSVPPRPRKFFPRAAVAIAERACLCDELYATVRIPLPDGRYIFLGKEK